MSSSLLPRHETRRQRAISHGGLGGLVEIESLYFEEEDARGHEMLTWPRRKWKPPSIEAVNGVNRISPKMIHRTMNRHQQSSAPTTPSTPSSTFSLPHFGNEKGFEKSASLPLSRYNAASPHFVYLSLPVTPKTPAPNITSPPAELAGSLLLPSQGFPQNNPPATPPRYPAPRRRLTDEASDISSVPTLSFSPCSESDDAMDLLKTFSSPTKRFVRVVEPSLSSNSSDRDQYSISKPMSSMNVEELLNRLPGLSLNVVNHVWLPAMRNEFTKIKVLLQDAVELKLEAHCQLKNFGDDLMSISEDARNVSVTYEKALLSAESLLERDTKECYDRLEAAEKDLDIALAALNESKDAVRHKDQTIAGLRQTVEIVAQQLVPLVDDDFRQRLKVSRDLRFQTVLQIISDHSAVEDDTGRTLSPRYLRITEDAYLSDFAKFRAAEAKIMQYQELAWDQNKVVKEQSADLDECLRRYERSVNTVKERDHEVLLLVQHNDKCQKQIEDYENGMSIGPSTRALQERLLKENSDMDWTIQTMKLEHAKHIQDLDAEAAILRQKLGSAREEVLARKADVKNVITHTQAMLSPVEGPSEMTLGGRPAKGRKNLAKERAKKGHFPHSMSMTSLPFFASKIDLTAAIEAGRHSDKELLTAVGSLVPRMVPRIEKPEWGCGLQTTRPFPGLRRADQSLPDLAPRLRSDLFGPNPNDLVLKPRTDSLGVVANYMRSMETNTPDTDEAFPSPANTHKQHPTPPETNFDSDREEVERKLYHAPASRPPIPSTPQTDVCAQPLHKRVLSNIPEVSSSPATNSDGDLSSSLSLTSSDREAYSKSLDALNLIEFMRDGDLRSPRVRRRPVPQAHYGGREYTDDDDEYEAEGVETGVAKAVRVGKAQTSKVRGRKEHKRSEAAQVEDSPPRTVSEMYHSGQRINGR